MFHHELKDPITKTYWIHIAIIEAFNFKLFEVLRLCLVEKYLILFDSAGDTLNLCVIQSEVTTGDFNIMSTLFWGDTISFQTLDNLPYLGQCLHIVISSN